VWLERHEFKLDCTIKAAAAKKETAGRRPDNTPSTPTLAPRLSAHHPPPISARRGGWPYALRHPSSSAHASDGRDEGRACTNFPAITANHRSAKPTPQRDGWTAICDFPAHLPNVVSELRNSLVVGPVGWLTRLHNRVSCETWVAAFTAPGVPRDRLSIRTISQTRAIAMPRNAEESVRQGEGGQRGDRVVLVRTQGLSFAGALTMHAKDLLSTSPEGIYRATRAIFSSIIIR
jgi:hypothetical protein